MKPRIKPHGLGWLCEGAGSVGLGITPRRAYFHWWLLAVTARDLPR